MSTENSEYDVRELVETQDTVTRTSCVTRQYQ